MRNYISVTDSKKDAVALAKRMNNDLRKRKIKREVYVVPVSQSYVRKLTRKGYKIAKKNYGVAVRNK